MTKAQSQEHVRQLQTTFNSLQTTKDQLMPKKKTNITRKNWTKNRTLTNEHESNSEHNPSSIRAKLHDEIYISVTNEHRQKPLHITINIAFANVNIVYKYTRNRPMYKSYKNYEN